MSQLFTTGDQSIGASASASVLPMNIQGWFLIELTVWYPCCPRDSQESSPTPQFKSINSLVHILLYGLSHPYMTTGKIVALTRLPFASKVITLLFNILSRLVIDFLPRSKCLLISCSHHLQYLGAPQNKVCHCFHCLPIYLPWSDGTWCHDLSFLNVKL